MRSVNTAAAINRLWADKPYSEEMGVLVRSLAEGMINAAYLQVAPEAELQSYIAYDDIMLSKTLDFADEMTPENVAPVREDLRAILEERASKAKASFSNVMSGTSWTKLDLHSRAMKVKEHTGGDTTTFLSRMVYRHGHSFTHSTYASLHSDITALRTGSYPIEQVEGDAEHNLLAAAQSLYGFALTVILLTKESQPEPRLAVIQSLLKRYNDLLETEYPRTSPASAV